MSMADLMQQMSDAGAPFEAIMIAVRAIEARDSAVAERRAKDAARKRAQREHDRASADNPRTIRGRGADAPPKDINQTPLPSETEVSKSTKRARKKSDSVELPDWLPLEAWEAFVTMRKAMRGVPFTADAAKGIIGDLDKFRGQGHDPEKLLMKAVKRGWRGVFEADDTRGGTKGPNGKGYEPRTPDECERAADFWQSQNQPGKAEDLRKRAAELRAQGPPPEISQIIKSAASSLKSHPTPTGAPN